MTFVVMVDRAGTPWLIAFGRVIAMRAERDHRTNAPYGILYAVCRLQDMGDQDFRAPIPQMYETDDGDTMALVRWTNAIMNRPPGVSRSEERNG